ncbi:MAG TPA: nickel pincer cofactor biosynthesis protein LarC [Candidatus Omnitrophica bacterium]|nr:nickel pincer cofactor biosynthesis protein LarC [Candidatus Omnitrophota bacterium]
MLTLYFDIIGGASGDMTVAALLDLGVDIGFLKKELKKIKVGGYSIKKGIVERGHIKAARFIVTVEKPANYSYAMIVRLINNSGLSEGVKKNILKVYGVLCSAETKVHGHEHKDICFHQLGDIDSIVDIASACICLEKLGVKRILYSAIPLNYGLAPATTELLAGDNVYFTGRIFENLTPTGVAILRALGSQADPRAGVLFRIGRSGNGGGAFNPPDVSNVLRASELGADDHQTEEVVVVESNIDDMDPRFFEYVFERLFACGALDVFLTPVYMKKTRPGFLLTVLSNSEKLSKIAEIILSETTSIGIRFYTARRIKLDREIKTLEVFGSMKARVKRIKSPDGCERFSPEYEDCKVLARYMKLPLLKVYEEITQKAKKSWRSQG